MLEHSISYTMSDHDQRKAQSINVLVNLSKYHGVLSRATSKLIHQQVCPTAICIKCPWRLNLAWAGSLYIFRGHTLEGIVQQVVHEQIVQFDVLMKAEYCGVKSAATKTRSRETAE